MSVIIAIIMTALTVLLCGHILTWMNTPGDIYDLAYQYLIVIFAGIPATILYNLLSGYLRSLGNSVIPVIFLIIAAILNIGLDLLSFWYLTWACLERLLQPYCHRVYQECCASFT